MSAKLLTHASRAVGFPTKPAGNLKKLLVAGGVAGAAAGAGAYAYNKNKEVEKKASAIKALGNATGKLALQGKKSRFTLTQLAAGAGAAGAAGYGIKKYKDGQEKKAAFDALSNAGYDFDTAVAMVKAASAGEIIRNAISPAWGEAHVAKQYGKNSPDGFFTNAGTHLKGSLRATGRGYLEGALGGAAGYGLGALAKGNAMARTLGAAAGVYGGAIHGNIASHANQVAEHHKKYKD